MESNPVNKLIAVVGPTGSGKTSMAVEIAKVFNGVIISADSRQIYKGLDIGTNKEGAPGKWNGIDCRMVNDIPQLLIDVAKPGDNYTLANWLEEARKLLPKIWKSGQLPIVVGGTGLYVSALTDGYDLGEGRDSKKRIPVDFQSLILEIEKDRDELNIKSDERYEKIFDNLINEISELLANGVSAEWLDKIGLDYRYGVEFATQKKVREFAIRDFKLASRRYIRRQLTWWRHHGKPVKVKDYESAAEQVRKFLKD